jgi:hypothetical protein
MAASATGVVHGSRTRNRTSHLKRKFASRTIARAFASTTVNAIVTAVMSSVFFSDRQKIGSWKMSSKFFSPTQSRLASPAVTSVTLKAIARRNGTPTSAVM